MKNYLYSICVVMLFTCSLFAQTKYEKESRINIENVPVKAKEFVGALPITAKIKWYKEESLNGESIEAKFIYQESRYSVEFDVDGNLQDVEKVVLWNRLPEGVKSEIENSLKETFKKYRVIKIQEQYIGDTDKVLAIILEKEASKSVEKNYEIVLKGIGEERRAWYEYTFTETGAFVKRVSLVFKNTDNLEF